MNESLPVKILVADDTPASQLPIVQILRRGGYDVTVVGDGFEAIAACRRQAFDVILMDIQMPGCDGIAATAVIRARRPHRAKNFDRAGDANGDGDGRRGTSPDVPIIAVTAHTSLGEEADYAAAGMDDYLPKPVEAETLLRRVKLWSARRRAGGAGSGIARPEPPLPQVAPCRRRDEKSAATRTVPPYARGVQRSLAGEELAELAEEYGMPGAGSGRPDEAAQTNAAVFDCEAALGRLEGDSALLWELAALFTEDAPQLIDRLRASLSSANADAARRAAHSIKGLAASLGAARVVAAARRIETLCEAGRLNEADPGVLDLETELTRLGAALAAARPQ